MGFYEEISPYYDEIFPAGEEQLSFITETAGAPPKRILDVACGTGLYSVRLSQHGYDVWACDADPEMIRRAREKNGKDNAGVRFFVADMLELGSSEYLRPNDGSGPKFDCIFCIGNSIVHLKSADAIEDAVRQMKKLLVPDGSLILQIINFDRVLNHGVRTLPTIRNDDRGIIFQRSYEPDSATGLIHFDTVLTLQRGDAPLMLRNRVDLFPLASEKLKYILHDAGFETIEFFGDFSKARFDPDQAFMLVAVARAE